jgi:tetratricopeptide (TPR) repeat protein
MLVAGGARFAFNIGNLVLLQSTMQNKPVNVSRVEKLLMYAESDGLAPDSWASFRLRVFAQDWSGAQTYLANLQLTEVRRAMLRAWLVQSPATLEATRRGGIPPDLVALLEDSFGSPQSDLVQGDLYVAVGRAAEARDAYLRAISHDPSGSLGGTVYLQLGKLYIELEQWQEAITYLRKATVDPRQRVLAYGYMDAPLVLLGRRQEAIENNQRLLAEATERHWKNVFSMGLGYLYGRRDCTPCDFEKAYQYFRQAREWATSPEERAEAEQWMQRAASRQDH